ncbi:beta-galactosidase, partial [Streptomyces sp. NPDC059656]
MPRLEIAEDGFRLDDRPFRILSGGLHYFRVHPQQWADRLRKARLL